MKKNGLIYLFILLSSFTALSLQANTSALKIIRNTVAVTFADDGTLWRVLPTRDFIYIDYSKDKGVSYSQPVKVNQQALKISAWAENPPAIVVLKTGRILVLYYADQQQKSTSYFSYSDDFGKTFSASSLISDQAVNNMHYMDKMLLDKTGNVHFFWHDLRDKEENSEVSGSISLYHAQTANVATGQLKNELVTHSVCSCCRTAISLSVQGNPVLLMRMAFADGTRDHVLLSKKSATEWGEAKPVSDDHWVIDACPEHGPALAIDAQGRSHMTWFSLGDKRQGIFYAHSDDYASHVSSPMPLGNKEFLPSHPDVLVLQQRVVLVWTEFDGQKISVYSQQSHDRGKTWQPTEKLISSRSTAGYPVLLTDQQHVYLSWVTKAAGHQLIEVKE